MDERPEHVLEIKNLSTYYYTRDREVRAVDDVSLSIGYGENLGLVGESGCGKTTLSKSLLRITPGNARMKSGEIILSGRNIANLPLQQLDKIRWKEISMITQSAMNSLNPVYTVGQQLIETLSVHTSRTKDEHQRRAEELFRLVGLEVQRLKSYPHQLSGGMRQRVVIAMALALDPKVIIADEPTTALDVVVQDGIIKQLERIQARLGNSIILVTHDVSLVAEMCHRVAVMYAGRVAEVGTTDQVFNHAAHPYTMGLLNAYPTLESAKGELISIPGSPPNLYQEISGCPFYYRCPFSDDLCSSQKPPMAELAPGHVSACHYAGKAAEFRKRSARQETWQGTAAALKSSDKLQDNSAAGIHLKEEIQRYGTDAADVLESKHLTKHFPLKRSLRETVKRQPHQIVHAVDGVSFSVGRGEILGLAGESGSGKSTLSEVITGIQQHTGGDLLFDGVPIYHNGAIRKEFRHRIQMAFQDPYETLNPRFTVYATVVEPLNNFHIGSAQSRRERVVEALRMVELNPPEEYLDSYPHELSGGQRQRVAIARAIVVGPELLLADEPVSMLDVSVRAGVLNLFKRFRQELGMSIVYVSHDLATIRYICDRTAILYLGRFAEIGPTESVIEDPKHPYTKLLISAIPRTNPQSERARVDARGEIPSPITLPNGCRFHSRCSFAMAHCGWEGGDVLAAIQAAVTSGNDEAAALERAAAFRVAGRDLVAELKSQAGAAEEFRASLLGVLGSSSETMVKAIEKIEVHENSLRLVFSQRPEPEEYPLDSGRSAACYLYEPDEGR